MKRFLLFLTCLTLLFLPALAEELTPPPADSGYIGTWIESEGYGTLSIHADGSAVMEYYDGTIMTTTWGMADDGFRFGEGMWYNSPMELLTEDVLDVSDGWMIFIREGSDAEIPAPTLDLVPVGEEGEPFCGSWLLSELLLDGESYSAELFGMDMQIVLTSDGLATIISDGEESYCTWCVSGPAVLIDLDMLLPDDQGRLLLTEDGSSMVFTRMAESPLAGFIAAPAVEDDFLRVWTLDSVLVDGETVSAEALGLNRIIYFGPFWDGCLIDGSDPRFFDWDFNDGRMVIDSAELFIDTQGRLICPDPDGVMIFVTPADADPALFIGAWELVELRMDGESYPAVEMDMEMRLELADGGAATIYSTSQEASFWSVAGPGVLIDDTLMIPDGEGRLLFLDRFSVMVFAPAENSAPISTETLTPGQPATGAAAEAFFGSWALATVEFDGESYDPALFGMSMSITFGADGTVMLFDDSEASMDVWTYADGQMIVDGSALYIDAEDHLVLADPSAAMIFTRTGDIDYTITPAVTDSAYESMGAAQEDFFGTWALDSIELEGEIYDPALFVMSMSLTFAPDGTAAIDDSGETETGSWQYTDGQMIVEDMMFFIDTQGRLIFADPSGAMIFLRTGDAPAATGEAGNPASFVGQWYMCYCQTGGLTGDLRTMGLTATLTIFSDGTGMLTGVADEYGMWYEDEGVMRFGESGMPMTLLGDPAAPFLQYGSTAGGYMIFSQDETAQWDPSLLETPAAPAAPAASDAPAAPAGSILTDVKYVCTSFTSAGFTMDAVNLGAEYALVFHVSGTVDFTVAGFTAPGLACTIGADGSCTIDYYGSPISCIPTDAGVDLDYFGSMTLHFVPAE